MDNTLFEELQSNVMGAVTYAKGEASPKPVSVVLSLAGVKELAARTMKTSTTTNI